MLTRTGNESGLWRVRLHFTPLH